jgi:hypothetical protein
LRPTYSKYQDIVSLGTGSSPVILPTQEAEIRSVYRDLTPALGNFNTLPQKYPTQKRITRVAKVVESFPSKHEALSSNPSTEKNKRKQQKSPCLQKQRVSLGYTCLYSQMFEKHTSGELKFSDSKRKI